MVAKIVALSRAEQVSSDERWAAWVEKGREHDEKFKKRAIAVAAAVAVGVASWLVIAAL